MFAPAPAFDPAHAASPFLTFAVAVHRVSERLAAVTYVNEWVGPRRRVPVFGVDRLRELLADPLRRFFFVELLGSYTHVVSGSMWTRHPARLEASTVQRARPAAARRIARRRAGGGAAGCAAAARRPRPVPHRRVPRPHRQHPARAAVRAAAAPAFGRTRSATREDVAANAFELLELLGARWYRLATRLSPAPSGSVRALEAIAEGFSDARRVLNVVTDTYLFPLREQWFGRPAA